MSTTSTQALTPVNGQDEAGALSTEKTIYRGFAKLNEKGEVENVNAKAESQKGDAWKKLEASGLTPFNQNEFIRYIIHSDDGFKMLVPDETQRLYIIQSGLNYIQNSKANGYMVEVADTPDKATPAYKQKLERLVKSMGLSADETMTMLAELAKTYAAQQQAAPEELEA